MAAKHGRDGDKRDEGWGGDQRRPRLRQMAAKDGRDGDKWRVRMAEDRGLKLSLARIKVYIDCYI